VSRILGIDPGSRSTGFGVIEIEGPKSRYLRSGCIRPPGRLMPERLRAIFEQVGSLVEQYRPDEVAIEAVFVHRNAGSALKLGQAQGAAICAAVSRSVTVHQYSPRQIKQAVVGSGAAEKSQVQTMVAILLGIDGSLQQDAGDALAVALCHSHMRGTLQRIPGVCRFYRGRMR
jgi:crossover junction endodeoxyribonuclease RuvC